nr:type II toxin-antitoxin system RelE/ParE family toxin [Rosenbergiella collisarenosi]
MRIDERFSESAAVLAEQPLMGTPGKIGGTRERVFHEHYRPVYELDEKADTVWIVTLIHTAQCWPPISPDSPKTLCELGIHCPPKYGAPDA